MAPPPLPPGYEKHHMVFLEGVHCELPPFDFPYTLSQYTRTSPSEVRERIKDATILVSIIQPLTEEDFDHAPNLQCIAVMATGIGWIPRAYCAKRGITVVNCVQSNVETVGEHFLTLYFSSRRKIPEIHRIVTQTNEWKEKASLTKKWTQGPPLGCAKETLGIIGYGHLGKRFEMLARGVGFREIIISDRKGATETREGRVAFEELIKNATTIVVCCPRETETINLIGEEEFKLMRKDCLIINIARGGIVNEQALADALKEGRIFGAATDVMDEEPCGLGSSPLLPDVRNGEEPIPNLIITPHVAWFSQRTIDTLTQLLIDGVEGFAAGRLDDEDIKKVVAIKDGVIYR